MSTLDNDQPPSGLVAGKYQLVRLIGRGGMGSVWEARNVSIGTRFAMKFIEAEYADSAEARDRFIREARAAATIESKHLIRIYDHGYTEDGKPFIVMELLQGEPLDKRIERMGKLQLADTARILLQVSRGLGRAHEAGIIHRDLKPENIFLTHSPDDDHDIAKVLDFGIAKIRSPEGGPPTGLTSGTKTGAVLGTPFYMSPEQARGLRNVDHRTDLWSLGVIAFKCVTGRLPFDGESVGDLLVKICTAPPPVPSQVEPSLPREFDDWFARALQREPERRFQNAQELASALANAAGIASPGASYGGTPIASVPVVSNRPNMASAGAFDATAHTPQPGAMTGAPFTSPVPGVPSAGRGKVIAFAAIAGLLIAGGGTAAILKLRPKPQPTAMGITQPPPSASAEPPATAEKLAEPTPTPDPKVDVKPEPKPEPKAGTGKIPTTTPGKLPNAKAAASVAAAASAPKEATSASAKKLPPPPPPGGSKPKDDPGY